MSGKTADSAGSGAEASGRRLTTTGDVGKAVRVALDSLELAGSGLLLAPLLTRVADAVDAAARAGDLEQLLVVSQRFEELVNRLGLDAGGVPAPAAPVSPRDRAVAAAEGGPR